MLNICEKTIDYDNHYQLQLRCNGHHPNYLVHKGEGGILFFLYNVENDNH